MFFTKEDFKKIEEYLKLNAMRDTDFDILNQNVKGDDSIAFVHEGRNYRMSLQRFAASLGAKGQYLLDGAFVNMSWEDIDDDGVFSLTQYNSLQEAAQNTPLKYRVPGGVLAWINPQGIWQLHQFIGQSSDDWGDISLWKNFNDVTANGIEFTSSLSRLEENQSGTTTLECHTKDGSPAISMKLYRNEELIQEFTDTDSFTIEQTIDATTDFKVVAQHYSYTYEEEIHIPMVQTAWIGAADTYINMITEDNKIQFEDTIVGEYTVNFENTARLFIVVPNNIVLNPIALNGLEVPVAITENILLGGKSYNAYSSSNTYLADEYTFVINTYEGMQGSLLQGLQQSIGNMNNAIDQQTDLFNTSMQNIQEALNEVGVQLSLTDSDFTAGPGEKIVQHNKTLTISDGKDHSVSFNVVTLSKQQIQYYTITFNTMGGNTISPRQVEVGSSTTLPSPTKEGKRFGGWYLNEDYTGNMYSGTFTPTGNIILYAKWNDNLQAWFIPSNETLDASSIQNYMSNHTSDVIPGTLTKTFETNNSYVVISDSCSIRSIMSSEQVDFTPDWTQQDIVIEGFKVYNYYRVIPAPMILTFTIN